MSTIEDFLEEHRTRPWPVLRGIPTGDPEVDRMAEFAATARPMSYFGPELVERPYGADAMAVYAEFGAYCKARGLYAPSQTQFGEEAGRLGWTGRKRWPEGWFYMGLTVLSRPDRAYADARRRVIAHHVSAYKDGVYADGRAVHIERCTLPGCSHSPTRDARVRIEAMGEDWAAAYALTEAEQSRVDSDVQRIFGPFLTWRQGDPEPEVAEPEVAYVARQWRTELPGAAVPATADDRPLW